MNVYIDAFTEAMTPQLSKCFARFYGTDEDMLEVFLDKMGRFRYFFNHRREYVEQWDFDLADP